MSTDITQSTSCRQTLHRVSHVGRHYTVYVMSADITQCMSCRQILHTQEAVHFPNQNIFLWNRDQYKCIPNTICLYVDITSTFVRMRREGCWTTNSPPPPQMTSGGRSCPLDISTTLHVPTSVHVTAFDPSRSPATFMQRTPHERHSTAIRADCPPAFCRPLHT